MGGGSTTTESHTDPGLTMMSMYLGMQQAALSTDLWNTSKPYLVNQLKFSDEVMTPYYREVYGSAQNLLPAQTELAAAQIQESMDDIERNRPVKDALTQAQLNELEWSSPVREAFYDAALKGVNPETWRGQATADVEQQYAGAEGTIRRELGRQGLSPTSGAYTDALANAEFGKAASKAFARTGATRAAETESFNRLATGVNAAGRASGLSGVSDSSQRAGSGLNPVTNENPYSSSGALQGVNTAMGGLSSAGSLFGNLASANSTRTTTESGGSGWLGQIAGTGLGILGSWGLSKI